MMHSDSEFVNLRDVIETLCYMVGEDSDGVEEVMQLPSIDIVRCGECKHYKLNGACMRLDRKMLAVRPNDFCSYGEREGE